MLSIALITSWHVKCGIATYSEALSKALAELGVNVYIIKVPRFGAKTPEILQNVVDSIPVDKVDVLHCEHEYGIFQGLEGGFYAALKRLGKPIVTTLHAVGVRWDIDKVVASVSDRVIVHNEFCARRFGFPSVIIPHGAKPCEIPSAEEAKRSLGIDPRAPIVGYCGFISEYKGLEQLVEAMSKIPKAALLIAGGWHAGPGTIYSENLKQRSFQVLPGRCQWLGYVPDERLPIVYAAMDVVCYPSRFATESGALIMALSHGKAVLASRLSPFKEKEKQGALMTFKDVKDLTRKIRLLLKNEDLRKRLEAGARQYCEKTSWKNVAKQHVAVYEELLKG